MTKIAPTLSTVVKMAVARKSPGSYVAAREFRSLLAVARAAMPSTEYAHVPDADDVCGCCGEFVQTRDGCDPSPECDLCAQTIQRNIREALARFDAASGRKR